MDLFWTYAAIGDRENIYNYIESRNPTAAINLDDLFSESCVKLIENPHIGREGRVKATRELVVHRNYMLVYQLVSDQIHILRILHSKKEWP
ncbi:MULTISPECIES: type II toxin-antitoxin system RelE/ParE family toxin [Gammaproteobacteria]|uniref:type II toxin-antitoxin system RelE/ParE family toxin n=1 Tax=Gammaproteobacteria TaxID=1236 RepID=UPI000DCFBF2B|nr:MULTISPECIES: type II toxin-antitoxin system RelE/ParE family toxin [Gammaproteobacteria]RTE86722.1 type II toxin-antitoxin system RelE/ParE family toxin [Aliidiomarina sp. B3213]TCZ90724.1 type II toxin-antitoxin system RelE/ParE family toxin [Lysobacter sp. N42]